LTDDDQHHHRKLLEALGAAAAVIAQHAADDATRKMVTRHTEQRAWAEALRDAGDDIAAIGRAAEVLARRFGP